MSTGSEGVRLRQFDKSEVERGGEKRIETSHTLS
jgi:hypothetical protein